MSGLRGVLSGSHNGKFDRETVLLIRRQAHGPRKQAWFAEMFGVTEQHIYRIYNGISYAWVVEREEHSTPIVIKKNNRVVQVNYRGQK